MAVEHNMADLNITWWDLLQRIAFNLDWSYAALWTVTADSRKLIWKQGYFHMRSNDDANAELFHSLYSSCTFTPGVGFAGHALAHMTNSILWVSGDGLNSLERPVPTQTRFLQAAGIQTVVCLPLGLPKNSYVLELGTVNMVRETEDLAHNIKRILLHLLADGLPHLTDDTTAPGGAAGAVAHQSNLDFRRAQMRTLHESNPHPTSPPLAMANETAVVSEPAASRYPSNFALSSFVGAQQQQRQLGPNIYSELLHQSAEHEDALARHVARGIVNAAPPPQRLSLQQQQQLSLELEGAQLSGSVEPSPQERLTSPWAPEPSLSQMELSSFHTWTELAEAAHPSSLDVPGLPDLRRTSSAPSSSLAEEIIVVEKHNNDEIGQIGPFSSSSLDLFMAAADHEQQQQQQQQSLLGVGAGTSLRGSSSRSSMSLRSQTGEDTEISSAILDSYADCHISDLENVPHGGGGGGGTVGSSSTTMARESQSYWRSTTPRGSGSSSKETSPESNVLPPPRPTFGMISSPPRPSRQQQQQQQQRVIDILQHRGGNPAGAAGGSPSQSQSQSQQQLQQRQVQQLERQHSSIVEQAAQLDELKPDSTPRLVQFGNVLQLGNAAGQVTEAPPQEHDEAAVSHMLAERRRRNKQNENFSQLKCLIPSAVKMDKASVLAATITYIQELKERLNDLEQSNQRLKNQLLSVEQDQSSTGSPLLSASRAKGSPGRVSLRANSVSPTDEDMIKVSLDGNGNLIIEIRHPCSQPDTAMHIFACLKEMHFKVVNFNVAVYDNRIHASIIVKVKRKNLAGQSAVCAEVEQALKACLNNCS